MKNALLASFFAFVLTALFAVSGLTTRVEAGPCDNPSYIAAQINAGCASCCGTANVSNGCDNHVAKLAACGIIADWETECVGVSAGEHCGYGSGGGGGCTAVGETCGTGTDCCSGCCLDGACQEAGACTTGGGTCHTEGQTCTGSGTGNCCAGLTCFGDKFGTMTCVAP